MSDTRDHLLQPPGNGNPDAPFTIGDGRGDSAVASAGVAVSAAGPPGYELFDEIGRGGMGVVYRARDTGLDRDVAVKLLQGMYTAGSPGARRFLDEAKITGRLQHPGIPPVHQVGELPDGRPFLAMKLIQGRTLDAILKDGSAGRGALVAIFEQICQAVGYAHSNGVIHRDLKPANVMVGAFGEVQVMDWGLAKVRQARHEGEGSSGHAGSVSGEADPNQTTDHSRAGGSDTLEGSILGTPAYMAPEQARGEVERVDARSDVFGLGAILCVALTGRPPFVGVGSQSALQMAAAGKLDDAFAHLDACGAESEVVALAKRCLSPDRDARPRDAGEVAEAVATLRAEAERRARQAEVDRVRAEDELLMAELKAAEHRKRWRVKLALAAALVVLAAGSGIAAWWQDRQDRDRKIEQAKAENERIGRVEAEKRAQTEEDARLRERKLRYLRQVALAHSAWRSNDLATAVALLEACPEDLRGWEWHYLEGCCRAEVRRFATNLGRTSGVAISPDGKRVAAANADGYRVWQFGTGELVAHLPTPSDRGGGSKLIAFTRDGNGLITITNGDVTIWDLPSRKPRVLATNPKTQVACVAISQDGKYIVGASSSVQQGVCLAYVWNARGEVERTIKLYSRTEALALSPDNTKLAAGFEHGIMIHTIGKEGVTYLPGHADEVTSLEYSPDGSRLASGSRDWKVMLWDTVGNKRASVLHGHTQMITGLSFRADGRYLVTASHDRTIKVWDAKSGFDLRTILADSESVADVVYSQDGRWIATAGEGQGAKLWEVDRTPGGRILASLNSWALALAFSPDGALLASSTEEATVLDRELIETVPAEVRLWDPGTGHLKHRLSDLPCAMHILTFSPDGRLLAGAGNSLDEDARGSIKLWDPTRGREVQTLPWGDAPVIGLAFSPDGRSLACLGGRSWKATRPAVLKVWDLPTGQFRSEFSLTGEAPEALAYAPDGKALVVAGKGRTVRVLDAETGREQRTVETTNGGIECLAFSRDGKWLAFAHKDHTITVWNPATWEQVHRLEGHRSHIKALAFDRKGERLISASDDHTLRFWDLRVGQEAVALQPGEYSVMCLAVDQVNDRVAVGVMMDPSIRLFEPRSAHQPDVARANPAKQP